MAIENDSDDERMRTRQGVLVDMVKREIPEYELHILQPDVGNRQWKISLCIKRDGNYYSVTLLPLKPLMTDSNIDYSKWFKWGIAMAKNVLDEPPIENETFQGTIYVDCKNPNFFKGEKL